MSAPAPAVELKARSARARERRDGITEDALRRVIGLVEMLLDFFAVAEQISDGSQRHIALVVPALPGIGVAAGSS
ncbi:hypothetical protein ACFWBG_27210 [Nocardia salmonicida]|uniref:hypothetical protein n=1 Tax=Nocardia salmonicida TaxID=53431 RepID=UPI00367036C5